MVLIELHNRFGLKLFPLYIRTGFQFFPHLEHYRVEFPVSIICFFYIGFADGDDFLVKGVEVDIFTTLQNTFRLSIIPLVSIS